MRYLVSLMRVVDTVYEGWSKVLPLVILKPRLDLFSFVPKHLLQTRITSEKTTGLLLYEQVTPISISKIVFPTLKNIPLSLQGVHNTPSQFT